MKKIMIFTLLTVSAFMVACGETKPPESAWQEIPAEENRQNMEKDLRTEDDSPSSSDKPLPEQLPLSQEKQTVAYKGDIPVDYITAFYDTVYLSSRSRSDGSCLLKMKMGESAAAILPVTPPEGMIFTVITTDDNGNLYAVVKNSNDSLHCEIWKIDRNDTVTDRLDISEYMEKDSWVPWAVAVAGNGDIYLRIGGLDGILALVFDKEGAFLSKITDGDGKYWLIDAVGRGRDGRIYAVLQDNSHRQIIAQLDGRKGCIGAVYEDILSEDGGIYGYAGPGIHSDLLIYGAGCGVYGYNIGEKEAKWHLPMSELPFEAEQIQRITSLADGRLLFLSQKLETKDDIVMNNARGTVFYYVPAETQ